jgi:hypothetical protein
MGAPIGIGKRRIILFRTDFDCLIGIVDIENFTAGCDGYLIHGIE